MAIASVKEGNKILANGNLYVIELDEDKINPYFLKAYLESENGKAALSRVAVGATLLNLPVEGLKKITIPLPDYMAYYWRQLQALRKARIFP